MGSKKSSKSRSQKIGAGYIAFICVCLAVVIGFLAFAIYFTANTAACTETAPSATGSASGNANYFTIDENVNLVNADGTTLEFSDAA